MINIYGYMDFVEYLQADFELRKNRNPRYSYRAMAERLELSSSTVVRIMNGKRGISRNMIPRFVRYLRLTKSEADYFTGMVLFKTSKSQQARLAEYQKMIVMRNGRTQMVTTRQHAYYQKWYYTAVREFLRVCRFTGDFAWLAKQLRPTITEAQARGAIELLVELGLVARVDGYYRVTHDNISTGELWREAAIHTYQRAVCEKALDALDAVDKEKRDFSTMTMCYSEKGFKQVRELLKRTREELTRIEEADDAKNTVYQVNMQCFPLSGSCAGGQQ